MRPLLLLLSLVGLSIGADLTIYLPAQPNPFTLPSTTHATISSWGKHQRAPLSAVNTFVFRNVTADSYLVDIQCPTDGFMPIRVDIKDDGSIEAWETFRGNDWGNKGEVIAVREGSFGGGLEVRALGGKTYFLERPKFSILTILKSPMILMGLVSMGIFIGMPYIMDNMDPEMKAEFEAQQKKGPMAALMGGGGGGGQQENPLQNFDMAAYLAGSNKKETTSGGGGGGGAEGGSNTPSKQHGVRR